MDSLLFVSEIIVKVKSKCGNLELGNDCWWKYGGSRLHCFFFCFFTERKTLKDKNPVKYLQEMN